MTLIIDHPVVLLLAPVLSLCIQQHLKCYTKAGGEGQAKVFTDAHSDLANYTPWDDSISSCCGTGTWILHADKKYNNHYQDTAAVYKIYGHKICVNIPEELDNQVSSLRYAGSKADWCFPSLNLYYGPSFSGVDYAWYFKDMSNLGSVAVQSLVVNGDSAWTLYQAENYLGMSVCVLPNSTGACLPNFYTDTFVIGSIKKGCLVDDMEPL